MYALKIMLICIEIISAYTLYLLVLKQIKKASKAEGKGRVCPKCLNIHKNNVNFCERCGTELYHATDKELASTYDYEYNSGYISYANKLYCSKCGKKIAKEYGKRNKKMFCTQCGNADLKRVPIENPTEQIESYIDTEKFAKKLKYVAIIVILVFLIVATLFA